MINLVAEGVIEQSSNETIAYGIDCTDYPSDPVSVGSATLYDITTPDAPTDVSTASLSGSATVSGAVITTPAVTALNQGKRYRLRVVYTGVDANIYEVIVDIDCIV